MFLGLIAGAALQAAAAVANLAAAQPRPPAPQHMAGALAFDGAALGMTIGAWRSLSPPPGVGPSAAADCGPGVVAALRLDRIPAPAAASAYTTCAYDARFGDDVLLHSVKLDDRFRIDDLRYRFASGRLSEIDFTASVDAYNDIVARLTHDYGQPAATVRDLLRTPSGRFARVRQTWRTPAGVVSLVDPTSDPLRLSVRIAGVGG
jgi:hypothetical protein